MTLPKSEPGESSIATEKRPIEQARQKLSADAHWTKLIFRRVTPYLSEHQPLQVLEVGSAQGGKLIAIQRLGHVAFGIEPYGPAREIGYQLAQEAGVTIHLEAGTMESIPFASETFDFVLATSVVEHVIDLKKAFSEVFRVLRPGGVFWFSCESAMCPQQGEIRGFPLFGWYPDPLKRRIMLWAKENHPALIGYTDTPALTWMTPRKANRELRRAGFNEVWDRWELRHADESASSAQTYFIRAARRNRFVRLIGDIMIEGSSYAARKSR